MVELAKLGELFPIDYLVVGAGSAGCVVASRLSERPNLRVVLIESGEVFSPAHEPAAISDLTVRAFFNPNYMWNGLAAEITMPAAGSKPQPAVPYAHARVCGGGSSVNGMVALRGLPGDYDEWVALGAAGWSWADVLPFFRKLETDCDFSDELHGAAGPLGISRYGTSEFSAFERAIAEACDKRGITALPDLNSLQGDGHGPVPLSLAGGRRFSAVRAYLPESVQKRPNLFIVGKTSAHRLLIENQQVVGAELRSSSEQIAVRARHVILCGGAIASPTILLRSGIGDPQELRRYGISPVLDRRGVGRNLQNHPITMLAAYLHRAARRTDRKPPTISAYRYSSGVAGCIASDMMLSVIGAAPGPTAWYPLGRRIGSLMTILHKPYSRGHVRLDDAGEPRISFNMLADERDRNRMVLGWQHMRELLMSVNGFHADDVFMPLTSGMTADTLKTSLLSLLGSVALDSSSSIRRRIIRSIGMPVETISQDAAVLREWVNMFTAPAYHPVGTCRMGSPEDLDAVVDSRCCLIGVRGNGTDLSRSDICRCG